MKLRRLCSPPPQPHQNSAPTGPMQAFAEMPPLSGNLVSGTKRTFPNSNPSGGLRPLNSVKWNNLK